MGVVGLWLVTLRIAGAAELTIPVGWVDDTEVQTPAHRSANAWAAAWGGQPQQVLSTDGDDDFPEVLALLDVASPIPPDVLVDGEGAGRTWLAERVAQAFGAEATLEPQSVQLSPGPVPDTAILEGRATRGDALIRIAVGPVGPHHVALVMVVDAREEVLYDGVFEAARDELDDLRPPVTAFPRATVRWVALGVWLLAGLVIGIVWTRRSLPLPGPRVAGRQVAAGLLGVAALVSITAGPILGGKEIPLRLADTTPWGMALELALGGVIAAVLVWVGASFWERTLRPIASAPQSGTFARRGLGGPYAGESSASMPVVKLGTATQDRQARPIVSGGGSGGASDRGPGITGDPQIGPAPAVGSTTGVATTEPRPRAMHRPRVDTGVGRGPHIVELDPEDLEPHMMEGQMLDARTVVRPVPQMPLQPSARPRPGSEDGPATLGDPGSGALPLDEDR